MEGTSRGVGYYRNLMALLGVLQPYRISDVTYYFPNQDITVRYINDTWLFDMTEISQKHVWEIYSTERYFEEDNDA